MLVGFDFQGSHFFGEHPKEIRITTPWGILMRHMSEFAADLSREGCEVLNCSERSRLTFWPKRTLAEALPPG